MTVEKTSEVTLHFILKDALGAVIENTYDREEPARLLMGQGDIPEGVETYLLGLHVGERRAFQIPAEAAFGVPDPRSIYTLPKSKFSEPMEIGMVFGFQQADGSELLGIVKAMDDSGVTVDFNHPLAGQAITFEVEIISVH